MLSPVLFALFLNDLDNDIGKASSGMFLGVVKISTLLYADDLVLLSDTANGLQTQLTELDRYTNRFEMSVNFDKAKILVLDRKTSKSISSHAWKIGKCVVKSCNSYKYLGVTFNSNGTFGDNVKTAKENSYYALSSKNRDWDTLGARASGSQRMKNGGKEMRILRRENW